MSGFPASTGTLSFCGVAKRMCGDKCREECREEDEFASGWISRWVWMGAEHNPSSGTGFGQFKPYYSWLRNPPSNLAKQATHCWFLYSKALCYSGVVSCFAVLQQVGVIVKCFVQPLVLQVVTFAGFATPSLVHKFLSTWGYGYQ